MVFYSIFKRKKENGKGHYWYYCYTDSVRNVRVQKRCLGCATKREAYEYIGKLPKQIESEIIFKNYAAGYIERYEEQKNVKGYSVKKSSVKTRQTQLNILVSHWGEKKLASITTRDFENWLNHLDKRNATKNLILIVARSLFDFDGLHVTPERFNKLKRISESMIGKSIPPHCLRHTYNSRMRDIFLDSGTSENVLRAFTGHKSEKMTDHHTHKEAERRINALSGYQANVDKMFGG